MPQPRRDRYPISETQYAAVMILMSASSPSRVAYAYIATRFDGCRDQSATHLPSSAPPTKPPSIRFSRQNGTSSTSATPITGRCGRLGGRCRFGSGYHKSHHDSNACATIIRRRPTMEVTGNLVVTGTGFWRKSGSNNDIDISKLSFQRLRYQVPPTP